MDELSLTQTVEKLRRDMPRNGLVMRVCDELDRLLKERTVVPHPRESWLHKTTPGSQGGRATFDRNAYQREYMRKRRAKLVDKTPQ